MVNVPRCHKPCLPFTWRLCRCSHHYQGAPSMAPKARTLSWATARSQSSRKPWDYRFLIWTPRCRGQRVPKAGRPSEDPTWAPGHERSWNEKLVLIPGGEQYCQHPHWDHSAPPARRRLRTKCSSCPRTLPWMLPLPPTLPPAGPQDPPWPLTHHCWPPGAPMAPLLGAAQWSPTCLRDQESGFLHIRVLSVLRSLARYCFIPCRLGFLII